MKINLLNITGKDNSNKDWRDAFVECGIIKEEQKKIFSCSATIAVSGTFSCDKYRDLCGYVAQFEYGGFWNSPNAHKPTIYFLTKGTGSDEDATYEDAVHFLKQRGRRFN